MGFLNCEHWIERKLNPCVFLPVLHSLGAINGNVRASCCSSLPGVAHPFALWCLVARAGAGFEHVLTHGTLQCYSCSNPHAPCASQDTVYWRGGGDTRDRRGARVSVLRAAARLWRSVTLLCPMYDHLPDQEQASRVFLPPHPCSRFARARTLLAALLRHQERPDTFSLASVGRGSRCTWRRA